MPHPSTPALHVLAIGAGVPLVLVAGLGGLAAFWQPVMDRLSASHRLVAFDHPGIGRSAARGRPSIAGLAACVREAMDAQGMARAHIVGHSTGGLVAQALALDEPARVASLVLSGTWARPDRRFADLFGLRRALLAHMGSEAHGQLSCLLGYPVDWYNTQFVDRAPLDAAAIGPLPADRQVELERIDMLLAFDRADELGRLDLPVTVVAAQDDAIVPFENSQDLAGRIAGAQLVRLAGGHFFPQCRADDFCAVLQAHGARCA